MWSEIIGFSPHWARAPNKNSLGEERAVLWDHMLEVVEKLWWAEEIISLPVWVIRIMKTQEAERC